MDGYDALVSGEPVDPRFAEFTRGVCDGGDPPLTGQQIADAMELIERTGRSPRHVGYETAQSV